MIDAIYPSGDAVSDATVVPSSAFLNLGSQATINAALASLPKYEFNLTKAKQELAKSPYPHGFTTEIQVEQPEAPNVASAEIFASDLAKIGITAKVAELTPNEAAGIMLGGKSKLVLNGGPALYPDPEGVMSAFISPSEIHPPGAGFNIANYRNAEVDRLLTDSVETLNVPTRLRMIIKLLGITAEEAPYWPLFTPETFGSLSDKYVYAEFSGWTTLWNAWALDVRLAH
jgi:peptide/nickel transport system substrate-binding protein